MQLRAHRRATLHLRRPLTTISPSSHAVRRQGADQPFDEERI